MELPQVELVYSAIERLASCLTKTSTENVGLSEVVGRVLAEPILADRDSPALNVSAMDGYALRLEDLGTQTLPVSGTIAAGSRPVDIPAGSAVRIFTGAPAPPNAHCVIKREDVVEKPTEISLQKLDVRAGQNIRFQGENAQAGQTLLEAGTLIGASEIAAMASFGAGQVEVFKRPRVAILNTGDELVPAGQPVEPWQIRDSNGPTLHTWLASLPFVHVEQPKHVGDTLPKVKTALRSALRQSDVVLLTGGVSMGDTDYVPDAIRNIGGEICFHRLPIRPGRPVLGAHCEGKLILGLPGNPVSVAVTSRVIGLPLLHRLSGHANLPILEKRLVATTDSKTLHLLWFRLVSENADGNLEFTASKGSGDLVSLAKSDGFVEVPAGGSGHGPWPFRRW
jgi:molybdopterin molybdotransferase